jgi:relaxase-like protein
VTGRRPRRSLAVYPTITLARSITETMRPHRVRPGLDWIGGTGFSFEIDSAADAELGRKMMEFATLHQGSKTRPCELPCVHLALDWPALRPTRKEMEDAGREALAVLGMSNAMAVFVGHNGWQNAGLHIIACKIDPDTNHAYQLHRSHTRLKWWARRYGRGWPAAPAQKRGGPA